MITYLLQVTLSLGCFYGLYHFALRKETWFVTNRVYLLSTLGISLLLPWIKIYVDEQMASADLITAPSVYVGSYLETLTDVVISAPAEPSFDWGRAMISLYVAITGLLSIRLIKSVYEIWRLRKNARRVTLENTECLLSAQVRAPFSFFKEVYLPVDHPFTPDELREVLSHEAAHIRAKHTWDVLFMELVCILMWPNPFVYLYRKSLREVHEYAADAEVIKDTPWEAYARLLVTQQQYHLQHILSNQFYSQLKKRLLMMNQKPSSGMARYKYFGIVPLLMMALLTFSFREKKESGFQHGQSAVERQNTGTSTSRYHFYEDGLTMHHTKDNVLPQNQEGLKTSPLAILPLEAETGTPIFPGCEGVSAEELATCSSSKMIEYMMKHLQYPEALRQSGLEGKVFVRFVVGANGLIQKAEVIKSLSPEADQAALDLINSMNERAGKWQPSIKEGKAVDAELVLPISFTLTGTSKVEPYTYVEEMPRFPGCEHIAEEKDRFSCVMEKMYQFIGSHLWYPEEDRKNKVEGTGIVQFVVEADGQLSNIQVLRSPSPAMTAEMTRLMGEMASMPEKWIPGRHDGKAVPVKFTLPIKFVLQQKEEPAEQKSESSTDMAVAQIQVQPNPASGNITITTSEGAHTLQIFSADGKMVVSQKLDAGARAHQLDVSHLAPGQYIIKALSQTTSAAVNLTLTR